MASLRDGKEHLKSFGLRSLVEFLKAFGRVCLGLSILFLPPRVCLLFWTSFGRARPSSGDYLEQMFSGLSQANHTSNIPLGCQPSWVLHGFTAITLRILQ